MLIAEVEIYESEIIRNLSSKVAANEIIRLRPEVVGYYKILHYWVRAEMKCNEKDRKKEKRKTWNQMKRTVKFQRSTPQR